MEKQVESRVATGDENAVNLAAIREILAEDRKAHEKEDEERMARVAAAVLEKAKADARQWQAEKLAAEKAGRKDGR